MKHSRLLAACGVPVLAVAAAVSSAVVPSAAVTTAVTAAGTAAGIAKVPDVPVTHVIEVMLENHSFDNLFGSFAGADGIPANTSLLNPHAYFDSAPAVGPVWAKLNEGDVTAANWLRAHRDGAAAPVVLASTHERALEIVPLDVLRQYSVDVPADAGALEE